LPLGAVVAALAALPLAPAQASNGMVPHGNGAAAKGLSGAVTALALDTQAGSHNPVATEFFLIPAMGVNWMIDEKSSIGITLTPAGGMNTDYQAAVFGLFQGGSSAPTGIDLAQIMLGVTYAREIAPGQRTGITPVLAAQRIRTEGLEPFDGVSVDRGSVTNNGYDHSVGYGFRIGWQGDFFRDFTIGASHQSRMYMTEFTKYAGLFAEQGDFDFAPISNLGIAYRATPNLTLALDWQHIWYNEIDAIANNGNVALAAGVLGGDDGAGFSWEDMDVVKFGIQWDTSDALTLRTGISYNSQTFNDDQVLFNIPAPGVVRIHASVGASCKISENHAVNFSFTRAFSDSVTGTTVNTGTQTIKLRMNQFDGVVGHTYSW
jgi:long-chain fatty acid transport protein